MESLTYSVEEIWKYLRFTDVTLHAIAGGLGSVLSMTVLYPLDTVRLRLQVDDDKNSRSTFQVLWQILKEEGWEGVYRGASPMMKTLFCSYFVYFFAYSGLRSLVPNSEPSSFRDLLFSFIAAVVNVIATGPLFLVQTRMKLQGRKQDKENLPRYNGLIDGIIKVYRSEGFSTLWCGTMPSLVLCANPSIQMMIYEAMKRTAQFMFKSKELGALVYFILGAASKSIATVVTYPIQVLQSRMRSGRNDEARLTLLQAISNIFRNQGFAGLFKGLEAKLLQTMLNAAIMFMCYEEIFLLLSKNFGRVVKES